MTTDGGGGNILQRALFELIRPGQIIIMKDHPERYISEAYDKNANLATVVDLIASNASSIEIGLFEIRGDEDVRLEQHEILDVLDSPNEFQTGREMIELQVKFDLLTGNAYFYSPRPGEGNNKGRMVKNDDGNYQLHTLPPQITEIVSGGPLMPIKDYKVQGNYKMRLSKFDVLHIKRANTDAGDGSWLYGGSPAKPIRSTLAISNMANSAQWASFKNGGINGILSFKGASGRKEEADQLKEDYQKEGEGTTKIGKVLATSADVNYINMGRSLVEMAVLESETQSLRKIASHYKIDPGLVGDPAGSTFSNRKDARKAAYTDAYIPALQHILDGLNRWLCPYYATAGSKLELRPILGNIPELQPDMVQLWQWLSLAYPLTPNQKLEVAGFERSEDPLMDLVYLPANLFPIADDMSSEKDINKFLTDHGIDDYGKNGKMTAEQLKAVFEKMR